MRAPRPAGPVACLVYSRRTCMHTDCCAQTHARELPATTHVCAHTPRAPRTPAVGIGERREHGTHGCAEVARDVSCRARVGITWHDTVQPDKTCHTRYITSPRAASQKIVPHCITSCQTQTQHTRARTLHDARPTRNTLRSICDSLRDDFNEHMSKGWVVLGCTWTEAGGCHTVGVGDMKSSQEA